MAVQADIPNGHAKFHLLMVVVQDVTAPGSAQSTELRVTVQLANATSQEAATQAKAAVINAISQGQLDPVSDEEVA